MGNIAIVPIRYEDRFLIMKWRNEQIYHLRQEKFLTEEDQNHYFNHVVLALFDQLRPGQILFSYLENDKCIGYGGLVHINWSDRRAEVSFIIDTELEKEFFKRHWTIFLRLIEQVAFRELNFHKIYTYAFDLRPYLYEAIEAVGFRKEATLREHCFFNGEYIDVILHSKLNNYISLRRADKNDKKLIFEWANDMSARANSFSTDKINFDMHSLWFDNKMKDENAVYFICQRHDLSIGLIRFDKDGNGLMVISIYLEAQYRGRGLAAELIRVACREFLLERSADIYAYIKVENIASVQSFTKAGFVFERNLRINDVDAVVYKLSRNDQE